MQKAILYFKPHVCKFLEKNLQGKTLVVSDAVHREAMRFNVSVYRRYTNNNGHNKYLPLEASVRQSTREYLSAITWQYEKLFSIVFFAYVESTISITQKSIYQTILTFCKNYNITEEEIQMDSLFRDFMRYREKKRKTIERQKSVKSKRKKKRAKKSNNTLELF